jgi:predicted dehydrogenase
MLMRIGLIGAGVIGRSHAEALRRVTDAHVVAVADPVLERAAEVAALHNAQAYADYHDLLDGVDAVWLCTPPFLHRAQAETCAAAGKHLFVEKPLALSSADCRAIIAAARAARVKLTVGHVFRFYPVFQEAYRRFAAGELGDLITCWCKRMAYPPSNLMVPWRTDPLQGGGFTIEVQIHELDFVTWFGGTPVSVRGTVRRDGPAATSVDVAMWALITFANGSVGEVSGSWGARGRFSQRAIVGTHATIITGDWAHMDHLRLIKEDKVEQVIPTPDYTGAVRTEDEHFLRCIARDEEPLVTGEDGLRAVELSLATLASSDRNAAVTLPLTEWPATGDHARRSAR